MRTELNAIGCSVHGVEAAAITATDLQALRQLLYANRLIVLKQQTLGEREYCDFAKAFISPTPEAQASSRHREHPLITVALPTHENGRLPRGWHSETSYERVPKVISMLLPKAQPHALACCTRFIDMSDVYAALPKEIGDRLARSQLLHGHRRTDTVKLVRHPAVITHPHTRERILYLNRAFTIGVADHPEPEATAFLNRFFDFAESPRFVREVHWSPGDLAIWDNRFFQHDWTPAPAGATPATLYRISGRDAYPLCASQMSGRAAA